MATTGFWPIRGSLKAAIDYAENPDKTTASKFLDTNLAAALRYAENDSKTDERLYVGAINCSKYYAYEQMMAVKKRFGERGKNVAYHGYQSFATGEVSPEEAFEIGMETARRMWGDRYQVVVTLHLNTDNLHCHYVVNSSSFIDGKKFRDKIGDHLELRKISDEVCREHGLSVLENSKFYNAEKNEYWMHKSGGITHRDIIKADIEDILSRSSTPKRFYEQLQARGYILARTNDKYTHTTVRLPEWKRPIRLDTIGYTEEAICNRIEQNWVGYSRPKQQYASIKSYPLLQLERQLEFELFHTNDIPTMCLDVLFILLIELINLAKDIHQAELGNRPLTPEIRYLMTSEKHLTEELYFLKNNQLHSEKDVSIFLDNVSNQITVLERERQNIRNRNRRPKSKEESDNNKAAARAISEKIKPLREQQKLAKRVLDRYPTVWQRLKFEHDAEAKALERNMARSR